MGWLTGFQYRKSHVINFASNAGTNYQKQITVHYGSGTDGDDDVYLNSHCRTDFQDVRFTDDDGETELDYWIQEKVDSNYAIFWVEVVDDLSTEAQTIYIYYGKADATTTSDGLATFIRWDNFDLGYNLNDVPKAERGWTVIANSPDYVKIVDDGDGNKVVEYYADGNSPHASFQMDWGTRQNVSIHMRFKNLLPTEGGNMGINISEVDEDGLVIISIWHQMLTQIYRYYTTVYNHYSPEATWAQGVWDNIELRVIAPSYHHLIDDGTDCLGEVRIAFIVGARRHAFGKTTGSPITKYRIDKYFVRKFIDPEPSHGAWGTEETMTFNVVANEFPDNVSMSTTAAAIKAWLDNLSITVTIVYSLEIKHVNGFWKVTLIYV